MLPSPATGLIAALNHLLHGADWARRRLTPFAGRRARIAMPPFELALEVTAAGAFAAAADGAAPDVIVTLPAAAPMKMLNGLDRIMAEAHVEGNAEFATELSFVFRHLRWDAEEDLARVVGDIAAHRLVQLAGRALDWQRQAIGNLKENLVEYGVHESGWLVPAAEFTHFRAELRQFEEALARLEKRLPG